MFFHITCIITCIIKNIIFKIFRSFAYLLAAIISPSLSVFAFAHFFSSVICATLHWSLWSSRLPPYIKNIKEILPTIDATTSSYFNEKQILRFWTFVVQGIFKQILTEGERYVVTFFYLLSLAQQGIWAEL